MNRLEEYIRDHKRLFDEEPAAGHFERLQQKMTRKQGRIVAMRWTTSIAASIALLLTAGILWQNAGRKNENMLLCDSVIDIKMCYLDRTNVVAEQIESLVTDFDLWDRQDVMNDVQNIIDATDSYFESELPEELPDNMAKAILADYYRQNLESLELIVQLVMN